MLLAVPSATALTLWSVGGLLVLAVGAGLAGRWFLQHGRKRPFVVRQVNRATDRVLDVIKRPLTIAVLDEVGEVLRTGHYTRNLAAALEENREELKAMIYEKIRDDPTTGHLHLVPFHDKIIEEASETTLRVILEVLADPRTDELVSDLLRDNITQIRAAVRARQEGARPAT